MGHSSRSCKEERVVIERVEVNVLTAANPDTALMIANNLVWH
jgi:hypothetical protein